MAKKEVLNNDAVTVRVDESVADILNEAAQITEETIDLIENQLSEAQRIVKNNPWFIAGALVVGAAVGGFIAYKIAVKKTALKYEVVLAEEIEAAKEFYKRLDKAGEFETPESAVAALAPEVVVETATEALVSYQGRERVAYNRPEDIVVTPPAEDPRPPIKNVFAESDPRDWDYAAEQKAREENPGVPYVISFEEFEENPDSHEQLTLTYYAGDDTLADDKDSVVDNPNYTVGDDNLARFGHGSNDNKVVYIRNERVSADFEVLRSEGSYSVEVLGMTENELRHSSTRHVNRLRNTSTPRRFRERDDG